MNETRVLLDAFQLARAAGEAAALATVVEASGSTYRRPGARMLVLPGGRTVGAISGGCLERDVAERAAAVVRDGAPALLTYDTTADGDVVFGAGLGCKGVVRVLVEPLAGESAKFAEFLGERDELRRPAAAAVVLSAGGTALRAGERAWTAGGGWTDGSPALGEIVRSELEDAAASGRSRVRRYALAGGESEVFVEALRPRPRLLVFGAGDDALPIVRLAGELGWRAEVFDWRPALATRARFPAAAAVVLERPESLAGRIPADMATGAVVMTHNYLADVELLKALLPLPLGYLAVLGPKRRLDELFEDLSREGVPLGPAERGRVFGPAGVDIAAETPAEIALSILAEMRAVLNGRSGGLLRDKDGPIHDPVDAGALARSPAG